MKQILIITLILFTISIGCKKGEILDTKSNVNTMNTNWIELAQCCNYEDIYTTNNAYVDTFRYTFHEFKEIDWKFYPENTYFDIVFFQRYSYYHNNGATAYCCRIYTTISPKDFPCQRDWIFGNP